MAGLVVGFSEGCLQANNPEQELSLVAGGWAFRLSIRVRILAGLVFPGGSPD